MTRPRLTVALVPLLYHTVGLAFWQLLALVFFGNLFNTPGNTARRSLLPDLAEMAEMSLERANAAAQGIPRFATLLGPLVAGVLIAAMGASNVLWFDAATFAASALLIAVAVPPLLAPPKEHDAPQGYRAELMEGVRFLRSDRLIAALMTTFALTNFLDAPVSLLFAVYAQQQFGSAVARGLMSVAFGGGALAGTIAFGMVGHRLPRRPFIFLWLIVSMLAYASFALRPGLPAVLAVLLCWGLSVGSINPMSGAIFQERIPAALRGRVFGVMTAVGFLAIPLGRILAGFSLEQIGTPVTFLAIAAGYIAIIIFVVANTTLRTLDGNLTYGAPRPPLHRAEITT